MSATTSTTTAATMLRWIIHPYKLHPPPIHQSPVSNQCNPSTSSIFHRFLYLLRHPSMVPGYVLILMHPSVVTFRSMLEMLKYVWLAVTSFVRCIYSIPWFTVQNSCWMKWSFWSDVLRLIVKWLNLLKYWSIIWSAPRACFINALQWHVIATSARVIVVGDVTHVCELYCIMLLLWVL